MEKRIPKVDTRPPLGPYKRYELLTGEICYAVLDYDGYGDGENKNLCDFISDEMRADWQANRDKLMAEWTGEKTVQELWPGRGQNLPWLFFSPVPGSRPWAARVFDPPTKKPRNKKMIQREARQ